MNNQKAPQNYLVFAILSTILCCLPAGVVSIVFAAKVNTLYAEGKYDEAVSASKKAKTWAIVSLVLALVFWILYFAFFAALFASMV